MSCRSLFRIIFKTLEAILWKKTIKVVKYTALERIRSYFQFRRTMYFRRPYILAPTTVNLQFKDHILYVGFNDTKNFIQCCRCETICGPESPDRLTVPNVSKGGVIGAMARSNFLMTRRKVLKVKILRLDNGHFQSIRSTNIWHADPCWLTSYWCGFRYRTCAEWKFLEILMTKRKIWQIRLAIRRLKKMTRK